MTTAFWQGEVRFRTVRVFVDRRGEPHARVHEAATPEQAERWIEAPAEIVEEAVARARRVERAREHAEQIADIFRMVHAIAGERNPRDEIAVLHEMADPLLDLLNLIDGVPEVDLLATYRSR
jgi:acyl-CoA reductase-like NAD-dependent aldehyde dehydrogenase